MLEKEVKFQISELLGIAMTLVVLAIGVSYGMGVISDVRTDFGTDGCALNTNGHVIYNSALGTCVNTTYGTTDNTTTAVGTGQFNSTTAGLTGVAKIPEKLPTLATVVMASVVIGVLITYLAGRFS